MTAVRRSRASRSVIGAIAAVLAAFSGTAVAGPEDPWEGGQWGPVIPWPHVPVSAANLPDGRILTWSGSERLTWPTTEQSYTATWDPISGSFNEIFHDSHNMFCSHISMLADGRVFVNGGRNASNSPWTSVFDHDDDSWTMIENMASGGRWYPTTLTLGNGSVFTAIGNATNIHNPEVWYPGSGWEVKNGISFQPLVFQPYNGQFNEITFWPLLHLAPNGQVFHSGPTPQMHYLDPEGGVGNEGSATAVGGEFTDWYHKHGTSIMYDEGKLLTAGGWTSGTNRASVADAFTVDLNGPAPVLQLTNSMQFARKFHNGVMLPNGEVLVVGGNTSGIKFSDNGNVLELEIWNPVTEQWRLGAAMDVPRNYHSVALLLPDGRVLAGGGGYCSGNPNCSATHQDGQVWTPFYLFNNDGSMAVRPTITTGPAQIESGQDFSLAATPGIQKFSMIRMSSTTHGVNTDVRYLSVPFTETTPGNYTLTPNGNPNVLTPGYWMLFALDGNDVPSEAHILQANAGGPPAINAIADQYSPVGTPLTLQVSATDPDNDPITYSATGLPPGLSIDPVSGLISGSPFTEGTFAVTVTADDLDEGATQSQFDWTIFGGGLGFVTREWWTGISGTSISDLTSDPDFPDTPDGAEVLNEFEGPTNFGDNYGSRIYGYLEPDVSGLHTFWIATDDNGELWLSTDNDPANKVLIATVPGWAGSQNWTKYAEQQSVQIDLVAGERYYIEALMKEGGGGDNIAVAWERPGETGPTVINGAYLSTQPVAAPPTIAETMVTGILTDVSDAWTTVTLPRTYTNMVVVATPQYDGIPLPAVTRIRNASGNTFDIRVQNPSDTPISGYTVQYIVVEAGVYNDGTVAFEADKHVSTITDAKKTWSGEAVAYQQAYTNPVVLGQVMTSNDPLWSAFWASNGNRRLPPTGASLSMGKHVAEDLNKIRADETLGYIVFEAGSGFVGDLAFEAGVGPKIVEGVVNSGSPHTYTLSDSYSSVVLSTAGMDGGNGGWPVLHGPNPLTGNDLLLDYDEDQVKDGERSHSVESVAYLAISGDINVPLEADPIVGAPTLNGSEVSIVINANREGVQYSFSWGDGTPATPFSTDPNGTHTYSSPGRYTVIVDVWDPATGDTTQLTFIQLIHAPLTANRPTSSSTIAFNAFSNQVWNVNPDNDTVTAIDASTNAKVAEIMVGDQPSGIAIGPGGSVWVTNKRDATISVIDSTMLQVTSTLALDFGSRPHGIAMDPFDASEAYVTLEGTGDLVVLDTASGTELDRLYIGPTARQVSVSGDGARVYVTQFVTPPLPDEDTAAPIVESGGVYFGGKVTVVDSSVPSSLASVSVVDLRNSDRLASEHTGPGVPNYLGPPVISPDGLSLWVPSKQDNVLGGALRGGDGITFDQTVRAVTSKVDLTLLDEDFPARIDHDDASVTSYAAFGHYGAYLYTTLEGNRQFVISDAYTSNELLRVNTGFAPHGITISADGNSLYVHNFMERSVGIYDISKIAIENVLEVDLETTVSTVANEVLAADILLGKQFFYDAADPRLAQNSYMSCASCHNDGGQDGRTWDFTGLGEGLRNTITLDGRGGVAHGILHWSFNFNEIQDFEDQIRNFAGGTGLMDDADYFVGTRSTPLGDDKAGISSDLDALAAYITSLTIMPDSPYRNSDGTLTPSGEAGLLIYERENCASCHVPLRFTDSNDGTTTHDVGTIKPATGCRLGDTSLPAPPYCAQPLTTMDTPTLLGVWKTAPYLHDGSAQDLTEAVAAHTAVGLSLTAQEASDLASYLEQLDDVTRAISNNAPTSPVQFGSVMPTQVDANTWHSVTFATTFTTAPVVVMGPPSFADPEPTTVRVRNVTPAGFEYQLDEWNYQDGAHGTETLAWIAAEPGVHDLGGLTFEAGVRDPVLNKWKSATTFSAAFASAPVVLPQVVTINEPTPVSIRMRNISTTEVQVKVQEEEAEDKVHANEIMHYIAVSPGTGVVNGKTISAGNTGQTVGGTFSTHGFGASFPSPLFFGAAQGWASGDPATMRMTGLTDSQVQILLQEETSADAETNLSLDNVGWLVISNQ